MKKFLFFVLASAFFVAGCQKYEAVSPDTENVVPVSFSLSRFEECVSVDSKVYFKDSLTLDWDGSETASVVIGKLATTTSKATGLQREIFQESKGVFNGTIDLGSFNEADVQAVVVPHSAGAYFDYKNDENRLILPVASSQLQKKNGVFNPEYTPFFAKVSLQDLQGGKSIELKAATGLVRFNVYGKHAAQAAGELLRGVTITASGGSNNVISGTCEWKLGNTSFNSNGSASVSVSLFEDVTIADKDKDHGVKVFASVVLGGTRTITKVVVKTDRATYTKTISEKLGSKGPNAGMVVYPVNLDMSAEGWTRSPESEGELKYVDAPYSEDLLFSSSRMKTYTAVMQSFDIDPFTGKMFYSQLNNQFRAYLMHADPNDLVNEPDFMTIQFFGHVSNFSLEVGEDGGRYIWIDNFASKNSSGEYWSSPVVSRVKWTKGATLSSYEASENYYFGEKNISCAVDVEGDMITILGISSGDCKTYRLSQLQALPVEDITLDPVTYGGEAKCTTHPKEITKSHTIKARDCTKVEPLGTFHVDRGTYEDGTKISWQGFDIDKGLVYQFQGNGFTGKPSKALIQVRKIDGTVVVPLTYIKAIEDMDAMEKAGFTDTGYMEGEGVKVYGDCMYLGFASKNSSDKRYSRIFRYSKDVILKQAEQ